MLFVLMGCVIFFVVFWVVLRVVNLNGLCGCVLVFFCVDKNYVGVCVKGNCEGGGVFWISWLGIFCIWIEVLL